MFRTLKSAMFHRFIAGFSLGAIGMVALNIERVAAHTIF